MTSKQDSLATAIASEIGARPEQVNATIELLDGGSTVPFIARYRKEATGGLDDGQLRLLEERLTYLRELGARRDAILKSIETQGKLTEELAAKIEGAATKATLEDLYLPYKPKRRTKAQIAIERGLLPLADMLLAERSKDPETEAEAFLGEDIPDAKAALDGARDILAEQFAENPDLVGRVRDHLMTNAVVRARVVAGKEEDGQKYRDYFAYDERWAKMPSHRALALFRARKEGVLNVEIVVDEEDQAAVKPVVADDRRGFRYRHRRRSAGRDLAVGRGPLRLAGQALGPSLDRSHGDAAGARRGGGDPGLLP